MPDEPSEDKRDKMGYLKSDTAFGMYSGNMDTSYWVLRSRRGESGRPIEEDERPFPVSIIVALVTLLVMGLRAIGKKFRRKL